MSVGAFLKKHQITIGLVGASVVVTSQFGSCTFSPSLPDSAPIEDAEPVEPVEPGVLPDDTVPDPDEDPQPSPE